MLDKVCSLKIFISIRNFLSKNVVILIYCKLILINAMYDKID